MYQWLSPLYFCYLNTNPDQNHRAGALAYCIIGVMSQTGHQFGHQSLNPSSAKYAGVVENIIATVECWKTCISILLKDRNTNIQTLLAPET